ncbi:MAG: translesion error-prone DNA polymerase V autoproteolytic subunit [Myxococcota bacterium]|nr:translesion error-prone DNA polymerase V autoproteolytic subunit [Myxococcota bacterium]
MGLSRIQAGFPSPADGSIDEVLDLNSLMVRRPSATFFVRVEGDSMKDAGILSGDILVVDRAERARHGAVVLAVLDGEFTIKQWVGDALLPANPAYPRIPLHAGRDFEIWGVVMYAIHPVSCSR